MNRLLVFCLFSLVFSCGDSTTTEDKKDLKINITALPSPSENSAEPNFFVAENNNIYLSWIKRNKADSSHALQFSQFENNNWQEVKTIAKGKNWFVNWADFPSLVVKNDGQQMAAHWLQKRAVGTYDYDVHITQSSDGGNTWSKSFNPHTDGVAAEHGFVSMLPAKDRFFVAWLDGRHTKTGAHEGHGHDHSHGHGGGPMTLRTAEFDATGKLFEETKLDNRVCDCCQTDAIMTSQGPIVVYRDRSEEEVRDISIVRKVQGKWTAPKAVFADNWEIEGCPVNGPSVAANGNDVAVVWYTEAKEQSAVKMVFSDDAGASFGTPISLDNGDPIGRVAVAFVGAGRAFVCWQEMTAEGPRLLGAFVGFGGVEGRSFEIGVMSEKRSSGFPVLAVDGERVLVAWTDVEGKRVKVVTVEESRF